MADKNSDNLDNLLNSIRNEEEGVPEGLDDLLNDIRSEGKTSVYKSEDKFVDDTQEKLDEKLSETSDSIMSEIDRLIEEYQNKVKSVRTSATQVKKKIEKKSAALAVIPKRVEKVEEELIDGDIDPETLELLGIDDPTGLDYSDYKSLLKERMVANQMGSGIGLDQDKLREEYKRVKGKTGKFTVRNQKIKAETFVSNKKKPSSSSRVVTPVPLLPGEIDEDIKPERQSLDKTVALIASKLNSVDSNVQQTVDNIQKKDAVEAKQDEQDRIELERTTFKERENRTERRNLLVGAVNGIKRAVKPVGDILSGFFDFMKRLGFSVLILELLKFLQDPGEYIKGLKEWANGLIQTVEDGIKNTVKDKVITPLNKQVDKFNEGIKNLIDKINPVLDKLSFIPGIRKIEEYQTPQVPMVPEDAIDGLELPKFNVESKPKETVMGEPVPDKSTETVTSELVPDEPTETMVDQPRSTRSISGGNNQQALLDTIAYAEGTSGPEGYNTWFGGRNDMDLSKMTVNEVVQEQKRRLASGEATYGQYTSAAVGRYQMMYPEKAAVAAGFDPATTLFTPENQDRMVIAKYLKGQAGLTQEQIDGPLTPEIIDRLAPVFASFPNLFGPDAKGRVGTNTSYYGQGGKSKEQLMQKYSENLQRSSSNPPLRPTNNSRFSGSQSSLPPQISPPIATASMTSIGGLGGGESPSANTTSSSDSQSRVIAFSASDPTNLSVLATKSVYRVV